MPFLALNGVTIPTAKGGELNWIEIGNAQTAVRGEYNKDVRALKRQWKLRTKPVSEMQSLSIIGMLQGRGLYMSGSKSTAATSSLSPVTATNVLYRGYYGADGAPSRDENGVSGALYAGTGSTSIVTEAAATTPNILPLAVAECSSTAGFTALNGAVLSVNATNFWQGTNSLQVAATATAYSGVQNTAAIATSGTTQDSYVFSAYIKGTGSPVIVWLIENSLVRQATTQVTCPAGVWRRVSVSLNAATTTPNWTCRVSSTSPGVAQTFQVDGWMLEKNLYGQAPLFPTTYISPGSSKSLTNLGMSEKPQGPGGMTYNLWTTKPYTLTAPMGVAATLIKAMGAGGEVTLLSDAADIYFNSSWGSIVVPVVYTDAWHMLTAVLRFNPETGESMQYIYFNGALVSATSFAGVTFNTVLDTLYIGGYSPGGLAAFLRMNDIQILPWPADAGCVSGWYNAGAGGTLGALPLLRATGTFAPDGAVTVAGSVSSIRTVGYYSGSAWRNNGRVIEFALEEV